MQPSPQKARAESPPAREGGRSQPCPPPAAAVLRVTRPAGRGTAGRPRRAVTFPDFLALCAAPGSRVAEAGGSALCSPIPGAPCTLSSCCALAPSPRSSSRRRLQAGSPPRSPLPPRRLLCARDSARGRVASSAPPASASSLRIPRGRDAGGGC